MAAEVPVCDVLCEAVEYLSKLGANLRTRSEKLKGRKISKEKLKNAHAVQRAANKLLIICELSKKSLNNVENGVKKIINLVTASQSQSSSDVKTSSPKSSGIFQYFEFENYNLRISKSVPVRHFLSAKVSASRMSISMLDKYPVYYDCKLFRTRKLKSVEESLNKEMSNFSDKCEENNIKLLPDATCEIYGTIELMSDSYENEQNSAKCSDIDALPKNKEDEESLSNSATCEGLDKIKTDGNDHNKSLDKEKANEENNKQSWENKEASGVNNQSPSKIPTSDEISKKKKDEKQPASDRLSMDRQSTGLKESFSSIAKSGQKSKKYKRVSFLDDNSSDGENEHNSVNNMSKSDVNNKSNLATVNNDEDDIVCISPNIPIDDVPNENLDPHGKTSKPLIKCVNINELLKPDIVKNVSSSETGEKHKNTLEKNEHKKSKYCESNSKVPMKTEDEEYWEQKRKEVSAFKAKNFSIIITRLPILNNEFLMAHNLKKVTKFGELLLEHQLDKCLPCEYGNTLETPSMPTSKKSDKEEKFKNIKITDETKRIKNALLIESDSENDKGQKIKGSKNCKRKRTNEDSEDLNQGNEDSNVKNAESTTSKGNIEDTVGNNKKDHEKNHQRQCITPERSENNDEIKSALLNDSSEDLTPQKKKRKTDEASPTSKKAETDSLHAKEMLLTYSSSESEDEKLNDALKNIKHQLLKGGSSDEENPSQQEESKKVSDSEHDKNEAASEDVATAIKDQHSDSGKETDSSSSNNKSKKKKKKKIARSRVKFRRKNISKSEARDENDINGLLNLRSLTRRRRRVSTSSSDTSVTALKRSPRIRNKMDKKAPRISKEDFLEAHSESASDSDAVSEAENEAEIEELPSVPVTSLNGDSIGHLAKDDLLGESDSSASNDDKTDEKETEDSKKTTSDTDDSKVKSKRRKANAISSDSEAGSSRKKDKDVKLSDFEDSEDEGSESVKPNSKRKKVTEENEASDSGSNDGGKKKRRRIKQVDDSDISGSEDDDDDGETEGRNKHGRKNIRKVMGKNQLEEATKKAAREEKERVARIAERQKMYNNLDFDESGKPDEVVLEKVVLDFDPATKEPLIQVDRGLVKKLKPHQANGIKFMWDACFESVKRIKKDKGSGCILAHCMGLGKTLQVISLTHTLLSHSDLTGVQRVLVVCPLSTVLNWVNEIKMWLKHIQNDCEVDVYELSRYKQNSERAFQLQQWFDHGGVCVLGYEMFRNLSADNSKKFKKKMLKSFQQSLVDPGPDLVVCDEGHLLKNEKTSLSQSMNRVKTRRRIVLTGTPLQNNLKEYYCMVQFVKPNLLGKYNEYLNRFVNPITNGQYTDSTEHDIKIMKRRSHVLHKMLDGAVQRRDYGVLAPFLPPKHEYVLFITLSEVQVKLYQHYLDNFSRRPLPGKSSGFLFPDFQSLQRIWTHPLVLKYNSERYEIMQQKKREREEEEDSEGSLVDFIDDDSTPDESSTEESSDMSDASDDSRKKSKKKKNPKKSKTKDGKLSTRRGTRANPVEMVEAEADDVIEVKNENPTEWWIKLVSDEELDDMRNSHKLVLLFDILRQCEAIGDKLLVFSQSLYSLDLIEHFLGKVDEATQEGRIDEKLGGHVGSWSPGVDYFRLDGSTSCENRSIWCKNFNREDNPRARLFLISTRAGGLGINLVAANRVVIFDVSWNPSHDVQSIFRVYRFGQKKPCYVYRFLAMGTMEEKIYERQVTKQAISKRVIDEQQIDRHYKENDLAELYTFEPQPPGARPLPPLPKDRLFAEMLREHDKEIYKYHEHDSLLENKEEETLSEEERKAAWEDFENEKNRPPPAPFPAPWGMHNGMAPGLFVQQQQQLAYAAIAAMLRKDMPSISDSQIRDMLPLIYNSNPALMQKMSEIYKYAATAQPGLMNPAAMMNPVMNTGGAGGGSGLQYEPPWQRQQQHMLQQMLQQQQHPMGAKYYAGGLGSRDPVAMALQQQHARQLLEPRARPRGRPPARPAPDVVDLDSD